MIISNLSDCIDIIKNKGVLINKDNLVELYKIKYYCGYIMIRLYKYNNGNNYYKHCTYQEHNSSNLVYPIMWTPFSVQKFCEKFLCDDIEIFEKFISFDELKKIKPKRICLKRNQPVWIDKNNIFYLSRISNINKKELDEWNEFSKNSKDAVYIKYKFSNEAIYTKRWFNNIDVFKSFISQEYYNRNKYTDCNILTYDYSILIYGYDKNMNPMQRMDILQLPYFNIDEKLKEYSIEQCAKQWKSITHCDVNIEFFVNTIKSYIKYKEKIKKGDNNG